MEPAKNTLSGSPADPAAAAGGGCGDPISPRLPGGVGGSVVTTSGPSHKGTTASLQGVHLGPVPEPVFNASTGFTSMLLLPAPPSTPSVTPAKRSRPASIVSDDRIKCSNCKQAHPKSSYEHKKSMGTIDHYKQCARCREKRKESEKARKQRKRQEQAQGEHGRDGQQSQQQETQREEQKMRPDDIRQDPLRLEQSRIQEPQGDGREQVRLQHHQAQQRQLATEDSDVDRHTRKSTSHSMNGFEPEAEPYFYPCTDLLRHVGSDSSATSAPITAPVTPTAGPNDFVSTPVAAHLSGACRRRHYCRFPHSAFLGVQILISSADGHKSG